MEAGPPFVVFERWVPPASTSCFFVADAWRIKYLRSVPDNVVRGTHPSKIAKGGAASIAMADKKSKVG